MASRFPRLLEFTMVAVSSFIVLGRSLIAGPELFGIQIGRVVAAVDFILE